MCPCSLCGIRGNGREKELCSLLLIRPSNLQGPFFGTQQLMVWDFQLLSPVHPAPDGHPSPVQDLAGRFLSLAVFQPIPLSPASRSLLDAGKARRREKERRDTDK